MKTLFGNEWDYFRPLVIRLTWILTAFSISRILFLVFNYSIFESASVLDYLIALLHGVRFDISVLSYVNSLFILLYLIPPVRKWRKSLDALFILTNGSVLVFNMSDIGYFPESKKRSTLDLFSGNSDIMAHSFSYFQDYWMLFVLFGLLMAIIVKFLKKQRGFPLSALRNYGMHGACSLLFLGLVVVGTRGGLQLKPLQSITASYYGNPDLAQLTLNTPFVAMQAATQQSLKPVHFMEDAEVGNYFNPEHLAASGLVRKNNVVILILESFSKEFVGALGGLQGGSPFLDSLCGQSLVFENAFANGTRSIEALPSIFASIPSLSTKAYLEMPYQDNALKALPYLLGKQGYATAFFHGGRNGTMQFDAFCKRAGVKSYYGLNEYQGAPADIDQGGWGVFDDPFLQFSAQEMSKMPQPFFASIFTLSAHHPYHVPAAFQKRFPEEKSDFHLSLRYADEALKHFFEYAQKEEWYKNTLFVIVADHTAAIENPKYNSSMGLYRIPMLFFQPGGAIEARRDSTIVQQVDIMPSVLDYLKVPSAYVAFGESIWDPKRAGIAFQNTGAYYQLIQNKRLLQLTEDRLLGCYKWEKDSIFASDRLSDKDSAVIQSQKQLEAVLQVYTDRIVHNQLTIGK